MGSKVFATGQFLLLVGALVVSNEVLTMAGAVVMGLGLVFLLLDK